MSNFPAEQIVIETKFYLFIIKTNKKKNNVKITEKNHENFFEKKKTLLHCQTFQKEKNEFIFAKTLITPDPKKLPKKKIFRN
jgi:hypothetical protein